MAREYDTCVTPYHEPIARRLLELAHVKEGERILDIGCGTGIVAFEAAAAVGEAGSRVGFEPPDRVVRHSLGKSATLRCRPLRFLVIGPRGLRFPPRAFRGVL